jgi:phosphate transport system protein
MPAPEPMSASTNYLEGHTVRRYDGDLTNLNLMVLEMGGLAVEQCRLALEALRTADAALAARVLAREDQVDALELELDDNLWWLVGQRAPVGRDLRAVVAVSKAVTDLERVGDEAARIARSVRSIFGDERERRRPSIKLLRDVQAMGRLALKYVEEAVALYDNFDADKAQALIARDGELDEEFQASLRRVSTFLLEDARNVGHVVEVVLMTKALERVGDHARNLAEYVVYLIGGKDIRHPHARTQAQ